MPIIPRGPTAAGSVLALLLLALLLLARELGSVGVGRPAGDRLPLVLVGVVALLAADGHLAVVVVAHLGRAELLLGALVVAVVALAAAERDVLGLVGRPFLQVGGELVLVLPLLHRLLGLLVLLLGGLGGLVRLGLA